MIDKQKSLMPTITAIVCDQGTERPHSGEYNEFVEDGTYLCRRCGWALFRAVDQFSTRCGWPSFDAAIPDRVLSRPDWDEQRIEICCARCDAHLGHVFTGEYLTPKNRRYCVNSVALDFVANTQVDDTQEAIVAGGCFWGVEYLMCLCPGVLAVNVGYMGGDCASPAYAEVCQGLTGHYEVTRVIFDPQMTSYSQVLQYFFEIHDPTQVNGQGPDHGPSYQSAVFCYDQQQTKEANALINRLKKNQYAVVTKVLPMAIFWPAEDEHQHYYSRRHQKPTCHQRVERFRLIRSTE